MAGWRREEGLFEMCGVGWGWVGCLMELELVRKVCGLWFGFWIR